MHAPTDWRIGDVIALLERLEHARITEDERAVLELWWTQLEHVSAPPGLRSGSCERCGFDFDAALVSRHQQHCARHPLRLRAERLERLASAAGLPVPVQVVFRDESADRDFRTDFSASHALNQVCGPQSRERVEAARTFSEALLTKLHLTDRESDPCPWCDGVFDLQQFPAHLLTCRLHPGGERCDVLEDQLREQVGELEFSRAVERDRSAQLRASLEELVRACREYSDSMGWFDTGRYYTKKWSELPWKRALTVAEDVTKAERRESLTQVDSAHLAALTALVRASWSFWNGMGDGEDGRSLIHADDSEDWEAVVQLAADRLGG